MLPGGTDMGGPSGSFPGGLLVESTIRGQVQTNRDWPAGALIPEPNLMRQWAWRALRAAREEIHLAVESVMEDLEGLGAGCSGSSDSPPAYPSGSHAYLDEIPTNGSTTDTEEVDADAVLRVDDLMTPAPVRIEYEEELETEPLCTSDYGFEIIDFEKEARIMSF